MLFNSLQFLIFFPIVVLLYFIIPRKIRYIWLLLASYYFYMCWNAKYALLLLFSTAVTYVSGIILEKIKTSFLYDEAKLDYKKLTVAFSFILNLSVLGFFKYTNFALDILCDIFKVFHIELNVPSFDILLPVGISCYIFQGENWVNAAFT